MHPVSRDGKKDLLVHLIKKNDWDQVLVFTRMKHGANRLTEHLNKAGISAMAIHGNKSQTARTKALAEFKTGDLEVLVATDIAARGIDIDQLPHVVNYELPNVPEDYVHRIGRTGRAGSTGEAISLVCVDEEGFLRDIERLIKRSIPREVVPGFEPNPNERAEPIVLGRMVIGEGAEPRRPQQRAPQRQCRRRARQPRPPRRAAVAQRRRAGRRALAGAALRRRPQRRWRRQRRWWRWPARPLSRAMRGRTGPHEPSAAARRPSRAARCSPARAA